MKIIDSHLHFSNIRALKEIAKRISFVDYSSEGLRKEFEAAGVVAGIGMGAVEHEDIISDSQNVNPMGLDLEEKIPDELVYCIGINPLSLKERKDKDLLMIEERLQDENVAGIKIYAGYYHFYAYDEVYEPVYELAAEYGLPVVVHTGDTSSEEAILKYAHPLTIDELAVTHRNINFIIAHIGVPWTMDAAEVAYKNSNVFVDMSGLIAGDEEIRKHSRNSLFSDRIRMSLVYTNDYEKYLFGTDWPLVKIGPYVEFIKGLVPEEHHQRVFYGNAVRIFHRIQKRVEKLSKK